MAAADAGSRSDEAMVAAWWEYQRLFAGDRSQRQLSEEGSWGWQAVSNAVDAGSPEAIRFLLLLVDSAATSHDLELLGAGMLEQLIVEHGRRMALPEGKDLLNALSEATRRNSRFREALGSVWYQEADVPPEIRPRLPGLPAPFGT
jgi:hypothetical protein